MVPIVIIPGWRDAPPVHWQNLWTDQLPGAVRVQQNDWVTPPRKPSWTNPEAGFGPWPLGLALLQSLIGEASALQHADLAAA